MAKQKRNELHLSLNVNGVEVSWKRSFMGYNVLFWITQGVGLTALVLLVVWVFSFRNGLAWNTHPKIQFNWHALCMPLALIYLCSLEIMVFRALRYRKKKHLKLIHAGFIFIIVFLLVIGYWAILDCHNYQGKPNWFSLHSWMGILTTILYLSQGIMGCASFLWPGAAASFRVTYMPFHVFVGLTTFVMGTASALLGMFEEMGKIPGYNKFSGEGVMMNICGMMFVVFSILVVYIQTRPNYKQESLANE